MYRLILEKEKDFIKKLNSFRIYEPVGSISCVQIGSVCYIGVLLKRKENAKDKKETGRETSKIQQRKRTRKENK